MREVWVCSRGDRHEGGGVEGVFSNRSAAYAWLVDQHREAQAGAVEMNAFEWRDPSRPWVVSEIRDEKGVMLFEDNIEYWIARPMRVHDSYPIAAAALERATPAPETEQ